MDETGNGQWIKWMRKKAENIPIFSFNLLNTEDLDDEDVEEVWINTKSNLAIDLAIQENAKKPKLSAEQIVSMEYHNFMDSEEKANHFPVSRPWDHKIEMKDDFKPKSFKLYNLTPEEQIELDNFLKKNLEKGYI